MVRLRVFGWELLELTTLNTRRLLFRLPESLSEQATAPNGRARLVPFVQACSPGTQLAFRSALSFVALVDQSLSRNFSSANNFSYRGSFRSGSQFGSRFNSPYEIAAGVFAACPNVAKAQLIGPRVDDRQIGHETRASQCVLRDG